jgi:hypothetical protein
MMGRILGGGVDVTLLPFTEIANKHRRLGWAASILPIIGDLIWRLLCLPFYCSLGVSDIDAVATALSEVASA